MNTLGYDFAIFWNAARVFISGRSPYIVQGFYSPLPFLLTMVPLGLLPYAVAFFVWTVFNILALVTLAKRHALRALLFLPVFFALWVGQVDLIIVALSFSGTWWGVALTTLKPQLAIWLVPIFVVEWWKAGKVLTIIKMASAAVLLYILPSILQPGWWLAWLSATPSILQYAKHASSLFGISAVLDPPIPIVISFLAIVCYAILSFIVIRPHTRSEYLSWVATINPLANIYSQCLLVFQVDWIAVALSWLLVPLTLYFHTGLPWALVPLYLLWRARQLPNNSLEEIRNTAEKS